MSLCRTCSAAKIHNDLAGHRQLNSSTPTLEGWNAGRRPEIRPFLVRHALNANASDNVPLQPPKVGASVGELLSQNARVILLLYAVKLSFKLFACVGCQLQLCTQEVIRALRADVVLHLLVTRWLDGYMYGALT